MKKGICLVVALTLAVGAILCSCTPQDKIDEDESTSSSSINEPVVSIAGEDEEKTENREETTDEQHEQTSESTSQAESSAWEQTDGEEVLVGYTANNYPITVKDGITYVNGVLVANKTYALPSDYNPGELLSECQEAFDTLQAAAAQENLSIWISSGFRSYSLQESLYTRYSAADGQAAADRYSARPGHSEHQSGLAIDLNTITQSFANTAEGKWIAENCWKYGFILRYPKEKEAQTGYMYEPWHIRYVGLEAAEEIFKSGLCLEEYYGITSQYDDLIDSEEPMSQIDTIAVA